ncbi:hypothetical protein Poli38472_013865 [Pythium oligandrum]|uniref:Uncharacterized protein n=1 Tax=Pythium oligandrum TaxID=41045 RepID=A0A8K1C2D2_PYTOL|nr:hypothetical protein Poli38472_013865 [Pythium oligandrum]|eukprot:TMW55103.1 hypothetical protein Poli38472_013865 [Pythium oligandrum]
MPPPSLRVLTRAATFSQGRASSKEPMPSAKEDPHEDGGLSSVPEPHEDDESGSSDEEEDAIAVTPVTTAVQAANETKATIEKGDKTITRTVSAPVMKQDVASNEIRPRKVSVAALIRSFSPKGSRKATTANAPATTTPTEPAKHTKTTFGSLKRSSLSKSPVTETKSTDQSKPADNTDQTVQEQARRRSGLPPSPSSVSKWKQVVHRVAKDAERLKIKVPPQLQLATVDHKDGDQERSYAVSEDTGRGFVDEVRSTLNRLVELLDSIDARKLSAIRLGGELRGLLGKAQDEFSAYEDAFLEHATKVGVAIALQNFASSLHQVFPIVERLQTTKFLLNRTFKREVTFAFQEINSYYTSLFMELSMSVAKNAGLVLPLPSPIKPTPIAEEREPEPQLPPPPPLTIEDPPKAPTGDNICLEAHQYFFGHGRQVDLSRAHDLYKVDKAPHQKTGAQTQEFLRQARAHFTQAASNGHREAQFRVAQLLESGIDGVESPDVLQATHWYRRAAEQNYPKAEAALGRILFDEPHFHDEKGPNGRMSSRPTRDVAQAVHFLQRAAGKNDPDALTLLGVIYSRDQDVKSDVDRAIAFLRRAVAAGNHHAMYHLAKVLLTSCHETFSSSSSVPLRNQEDLHDEAFTLLLNAAHNGGITDAFFELGEILDKSKFLRDPQAALRHFVKAATAKQPHIVASKRAAAMFYAGRGCSVDRWKAHHYYSIASEAGDDEALNALGLMYEEGDGCDLDFRKAAECFRKAAAQQNAHAHFNLGCLLSHGKGVARNLVSAQAHFQKAFQLGYTLAQDFLQPAT